MILGDEGSVTLVEVGHELKDRFHPGERYVIQPAVDHPPINHPERYRDGGRGVVKVSVGYTLPGHLAEYVLITEETVAAGCLLPIPDPSFPFAHAALSEPLSCCVPAQSRARSPGSAAIMAAFGAGWKPALLTSEPETEALPVIESELNQEPQGEGSDL